MDTITIDLTVGYRTIRFEATAETIRALQAGTPVDDTYVAGKRVWYATEDKIRIEVVAPGSEILTNAELAALKDSTENKVATI